MKFSTFFGKYTICALIYSVFSMLLGIAGFGVLCHLGKKAEEKDDEENPITADDMNLNND
jgi:hypothetical protein|nr:MAG TPA: tumor necrosis factor receptor superfamily member 19 [Bacteriophage sp.]